MMQLQSVLSLIFHLRLACCEPLLVVSKIARVKGMRLADASRQLKEANFSDECCVCHNDRPVFRNTGCGHKTCATCWERLSIIDPPICFECMSPTSREKVEPILTVPDRLPVPSPGSIEDGMSCKTRAIMKRLKHELANGEKVIIVSQWTAYLDVLTNIYACRFPEIPHVVLTGAVTPTKRQKVISDFQNQDQHRVLFASLGSSAEGVTLTAACRMIIAEPYWNRAKVLQMSDRIHRIGQGREVKVYSMFLEDTIEKKILDLVEKKAESVAIILDCKKISGSAESWLNRVVRLLDD